MTKDQIETTMLYFDFSDEEWDGIPASVQEKLVKYVTELVDDQIGDKCKHK